MSDRESPLPVKIVDAQSGDALGTTPGPGGSPILAIGSPALSIRIHEIGGLTYIGAAPVGSDTADAVWQIKRFAETNPAELLYASGDANYAFAWDDHESLGYS